MSAEAPDRGSDMPTETGTHEKSDRSERSDKSDKSQRKPSQHQQQHQQQQQEGKSEHTREHSSPQGEESQGLFGQMDTMKDSMTRMVDDVRTVLTNEASRRPYVSLSVALGVGYVLGRTISLRTLGWVAGVAGRLAVGAIASNVSYQPGMRGGEAEAGREELT